MNWDFAQFEGSWRARIRRWLTPNGSAPLDGARLATINGAILLALLIIAGIFSILRALLGWFLPLPAVFFGFAMILATGVAFVVVWYRYTEAHRTAASLRGGGMNAGAYGLIAASPFLVLALMLFGSGLLALFFGLISFSAGRVGSAVLRLFYAMLFVALAIGNVLVARIIAER